MDGHWEIPRPTAVMSLFIAAVTMESKCLFLYWFQFLGCEPSSGVAGLHVFWGNSSIFPSGYTNLSPTTWSFFYNTFLPNVCVCVCLNLGPHTCWTGSLPPEPHPALLVLVIFELGSRFMPGHSPVCASPCT
jgi:hypothetical protein